MVELREVQQALIDIQTKDIVGLKVELGQKATTERVSELASKITALESKIGQLSEGLSKPFLKDKRFWTGIAAIPLLVASGWTIDKVIGNRPVALGLIHSAFGTQPVIKSAIETEGDPLRTGVETTLERMLKAKEKDILGPVVDQQMTRRYGVIHTATITLGLTRPDLVRKVSCASLIPADGKVVEGAATPSVLEKVCEDDSEGQVRDGSIVFAVRNQDKVDIEIGINVAEYMRKPNGDIDTRSLREVEPDLTRVLKISLGETSLKTNSPDDWSRYTIGGRPLRLALLKFEGESLGKPKTLPLHSLTVTLLPDAPSTYLVSVLLLVSHPKPKAGGDK